MGHTRPDGESLYPITMLQWLITISLTGMLHKVGLLPPSNSEQVPFAYTIYRRADDSGWEQANEFKRAFSINVDVEFLGVWYVIH